MNINVNEVYFDVRSGNYFRIDSEYLELQNGYMCSIVELDDDGNIIEEDRSTLWSKRDVEKAIG
jgi:hypothetical protein